jgi:AraC family transcriptional regulator of adaptative response/methylated-DNA-[protein]-cysteine methyltransferase
MQFFATPEAAEKQGFRACRRCHPKSAPAGVQRERLARLLEEIDRTTRSTADGRTTIEELAARAGTSADALRRIFRRELGISPGQYADAKRLQALKKLLRNGASVTEALYDAGYGSSSRLYERAPRQLGMTPLAYRRGGQNVQLRYAVEPCALGHVLVAATARGIAAVCLGDSKRELEIELHREFPHAALREDRAGLGRWTRAISRHLAGAQPRLDLPLDVRATAFERRVWEELRKIPYGTTRSYAEIARAIGNPRAMRAVARACAANPAAVVIPCHRVVRADGQPSGYRWGIKRKRALLETERKNAAPKGGR